MGFWVFVALVIAAIALRRVVSLERALRELRGEVVTLQARLAALAGAVLPPAAPPVVPAAITIDVAGEPGAEPGGGAQSPPDAQVPDANVPVAGPADDAAVPPPLPAAAPAVLEDASGGSPADSLEGRIGSRWLLYVGVAALVLGISYFVKFAFDNEWIAPPVRVLLGLAGGVALIGAGHRFIARGLERYGQTLTGGGVGILYLAVYAAHRWYEIVGRPVAFVAMVAITLAGAWLADRQRSQVLALFTVTIGFLTPFLVGGEEGSQVVLFTYDLILVGGTLILARRGDWPVLNIVSFGLTVLTISSWAERNYSRHAFATTEAFLTAFLVLFLGVLRENRKSSRPIAQLGTVLLGASPLLYHFASLAVLGPHRGPLLVYFILFSVAGVIASQHFRAAWLRLAVWVAIAVPFAGFASTRLGRSWQLAAWVTFAAIYGVHLIAQIQALDDDHERVPVTEVLLLHGNGLWALLTIWLLLGPRTLASLAPATFTLAVVYAALGAGAWRWHRDAALHALALAAAVAAAAAALRFSGPWVSVALGVEGAALVWLGLRERRHWLRHGGSLFLGIALAALLVLLARPLGLDDLPFLNARAAAAAFLVLLLYAAAWLSSRSASPPGSLGFAVARLVVTANVLTVLALSAEISAYFGWSAWAGRAERGAGVWTSAELTRQLTLSIVWAAYGVGLVATGLRLAYRPIRILAIVLFFVTIAKVFLVDLAQLDRVSRMLSVIGLGLLLLTASYLYQRLRVSAAPDTASPPPEPARGSTPEV